MGGTLAQGDDARDRRSLHVFFLVDCSGSMSGERIGALNWAAKAAVPIMRDAAEEHPEVDVFVRVLCFADGIAWPVAEPTPVRRFAWTSLTAGGETAMGAALRALAGILSGPGLDPDSNLPPVIILLSDGLPTDDVRAGLAALMATALGARAVRIPIAIGPDADLELLQDFIGDPAFRPLRAQSTDLLVGRIRWAASAPLAAVTARGGADPVSALAARASSDGSQSDDQLVW